MTFSQLFPQGKAVIAMLHLKGRGSVDMERRARREIEIFYENGVDAVLVENYFGDREDCRWALAYLKEQYPDRVYGVNILGDTPSAFALAEAYDAAFIQIDSVCGHLSPALEPDFVKKLDALRAGSRAVVADILQNRIGFIDTLINSLPIERTFCIIIPTNIAWRNRCFHNSLATIVVSKVSIVGYTRCATFL